MYQVAYLSVFLTGSIDVACEERDTRVVDCLLNVGVFPFFSMASGDGNLDDPLECHWYNIPLIKLWGCI